MHACVCGIMSNACVLLRAHARNTTRWECTRPTSGVDYVKGDSAEICFFIAYRLENRRVGAIRALHCDWMCISGD